LTIPETSSTGGQNFPLVAGAALSSLEDPVALGLLDYLAYWLNTSLSAQLAVMTGHTATAVPTGKTFAYDPMGMWVRNGTPALYVWWKSDAIRGQYSTLKDSIAGTYGFLYVSDEIAAPAGSQHFAGIGATVRRILRTADDRGYHPDYGYGSDPDGTPVAASLSVAKWNFTRLTAGAMQPVPSTSSNPGGTGEGGIVRYFPAVEGEIEVVEIVGQTIPRVPEDLLTDATMGIATNEQGDVGDVVTIMDRVLPAPDGTEQP
jgi:hypothetical protein